MKRLLALVIASTVVNGWAYAQETRPQQRQENRENRQQARQDRVEQRQTNRSTYYSNETWTQLDPWIQRNNLTPRERVARAADAAVGATEKALNTANAVADRTAQQTNARFGYSNPNGPGENAWFYDYYTYSPTYYNAPATGSNVYGSATRYYDLDNDGVYESLNVFRDSDSNSSYDTFDRYDFADLPEADKDAKSNADDVSDSPEDANRHTVTGKVYASKSAKVNGSQNLVVRLSAAETSSGDKEATIVDIGPTELWKARPLQQNDALSATGPIERIGDKRILVAESVKVGEQKEVAISRTAPKLEGEVIDVTKVEVKGKQHTLAVIQSDSKRQLVDLGPAESLKVKVEPQTKIVVQGVPVRVRNHSIVQAERVSVDGQDITISRW